jgi:hypothetical protein
MKLSYIIIGSLGLNAILVAAVVHKRTAAPAPTVTETKSVSTSTTIAEKKTESPAPVMVSVPGEPFTWHRVEAEDYHKYVANLRAIGCPEETVQDIIYNDVTKVYAEKLRALSRQNASGEYWKSDEYSYNSERNRKYRELTEEKKALLIALLGVDLDKVRRERQGIPDYEAARTAYLPEEKRKPAEEIRQRFQDLEQATYQKYRDYYGPERTAELAEINKQREAELSKLLTPTELEEYKVRTSQTATQMKYDLAAFEPSEQEFRALFKAREAYDQATMNLRFGGPDPDKPEETKLMAEATKLRDEEAKKVLGEERYKEYKRAQDYGYRELYQLAQRSGLPKETASKVYDMKEATEAQARQIRSDQNLSAEQRQQALLEIKNLAEKAVQESLGEKNYKNYQMRYGGSWIRSIAPETRSIPPGAVIRQ